MIFGAMTIAMYPPRINHRQALMIGMRMFLTVTSPTIVSNIDSTIRAIMSSMTAAETINCPTGLYACNMDAKGTRVGW
jgi:hypothetical protein